MFGKAGLIINCNVLIFNGIIELNGSNGINCSQNVYGAWAGGGGGGGSCRITCNTIIENSGVINQNGGLGGECSGPNNIGGAASMYAGAPGSGGTYLIELQ